MGQFLDKPSLPDAATLAAIGTQLLGDVLGALPLGDIFHNKLGAVSEGIASFRGNADKGGAHDPQAVEALKLEQRVACARDMLALLFVEGEASKALERKDPIVVNLFYTLDKIEAVLNEVRGQGAARRALKGRDIKAGFAKLDDELTTRMDDVERRLALGERADARSFRQRVEAAEAAQQAALQKLEVAAAAQQEVLDGATAKLCEISEAVSGTATQQQMEDVEAQLRQITAAVATGSGDERAAAAGAAAANMAALEEVRAALVALPGENTFAPLLLRGQGRTDEALMCMKTAQQELKEDVRHAVKEGAVQHADAMNAHARTEAQLALLEEAITAAAAPKSLRQQSAELSDDCIDESEVTILNEVARGSFGIVYLAAYQESSVAVKILDLSGIKQSKREELTLNFKKESKIMKGLKSPRTVGFYGWYETARGDLGLVMEHVPNGDVRQMLDKHTEQGKPFNAEHWTQVRRLANETAEGMRFLISKKLFHRDLKTPNLLLDRDNKVKVADFGLAKAKDSHASSSGGSTGAPKGSTPWMAPEHLNSKQYTEACDIFSLGVVLFELCTRLQPYEELEGVPQIVAQVMKGVRPQIPAVVGVPDDLRQLMKDCWAHDPRDRPTAVQVCGRLKSGGQRVFKNGKLMKFVAGQWKERECILTDGALEYHSKGRSEGETRFLTQLVRLEEEVTMEAMVQCGYAKRSIKMPHSFMLVLADGKLADGKPVLLAADTSPDKQSWLSYLKGFERRSLKDFVERGDSSCKLLAISGKQEIEAQSAGQELLHALDRKCSGAHTNVVAIFGNAREGKSTFLNSLAKVEGLFKVSGKAKPCTSGVDVSSNAQTLARFSSGGAGHLKCFDGSFRENEKVSRTFKTRYPLGISLERFVSHDYDVAQVTSSDHAEVPVGAILLSVNGQDCITAGEHAERAALLAALRPGTTCETTFEQAVALVGCADLPMELVFAKMPSGPEAAEDSASASPRVCFMDAEGQGDQDVEHDTKLVLPVLIMAKLVIFNWRGAAKKAIMLDMLGTLAKAAAKVKLKPVAAATGGAAAATISDGGEGVPHFGHLHIIMRDYAFDEEENTESALVTLQNILLKPETVGEKGASADAVNNRNRIRELLKRSFTSIRIWTFPDARVTTTTTRVSAATLSEGFKAELDSFRAAAVKQLRTPTLFQGTPLTCALLANLAPTIAMAMNEQGTVCPQSLFAQLAEKEAARVQKTFADQLRDLVQKLGESTEPLAEAVLRAEFESAVARPLEAARTALVAVGGGRVDDGALKAMKGLLAAEKARAERENENRALHARNAALEDAVFTADQRVRAASMQKNAALTRLQAHEKRVAGLEEDLRRKHSQIDMEIARKHSGAEAVTMAARLERERASMQAQLEVARAEMKDANEAREAAVAEAAHHKARAQEAHAELSRVQLEAIEKEAALAERTAAAATADAELRELQQRTAAEAAAEAERTSTAAAAEDEARVAVFAEAARHKERAQEASAELGRMQREAIEKEAEAREAVKARETAETELRQLQERKVAQAAAGAERTSKAADATEREMRVAAEAAAAALVLEQHAAEARAARAKEREAAGAAGAAEARSRAEAAEAARQLVEEEDSKRQAAAAKAEAKATARAADEKAAKLKLKAAADKAEADAKAKADAAKVEQERAAADARIADAAVDVAAAVAVSRTSIFQAAAGIAVVGGGNNMSLLPLMDDGPEWHDGGDAVEDDAVEDAVEDPDLLSALVACGLKDDTAIEALRERARKQHDLLLRTKSGKMLVGAAQGGTHTCIFEDSACDVWMGASSAYSSKLWAVCGLRCATCLAPGSTVGGIECRQCGNWMLGKDDATTSSTSNADYSEPPPPPPCDESIVPPPKILDLYHPTCPLVPPISSAAAAAAAAAAVAAVAAAALLLEPPTLTPPPLLLGVKQVPWWRVQALNPRFNAHTRPRGGVRVDLSVGARGARRSVRVLACDGELHGVQGDVPEAA
jgi:hypothetical protein